MKKIIVYCHGYGSSATTDKVGRLRSAKDCEVYAWDINIDPDVSIPYLESEIDSILMDNLHGEVDLVFVGTSLGAWYASRLAKVYAARAIIINPCYDPARMLVKFNVSPYILSKYDPMVVLQNASYVIAADDEVLNFDDLLPTLPNVNIVKSGGHRFNGPEFEEYVVNKI